jgi:Rieske Fe-S protein
MGGGAILPPWKPYRRNKVDRRSFIKICAAAASLAGAQARFMGNAEGAEFTPYQRAKLVDATGKPIKASQLSTGEAYVFAYPYRGTPSFLINLPQPAATGTSLKTEKAGSYDWKGGVGANGTVVAYSAICAHQLAYPAKSGSAIRYAVSKSEVAGRGNVIVCCAHNSVYDPAQGAKVLAGQATEPLAAVVLEYDRDSDGLTAIGTIGSEQFDEFFRAYKGDLIADYGPGVARRQVDEHTEVVPLSAYSGSVIAC